MKRNIPPYHLVRRSRQRPGPARVVDGQPIVKADGRVYMPCSEPRPIRRRPGEIDHYVVQFLLDDGTWSTLGQEDPEDHIGDVHWSIDDTSTESNGMETAYVRVK